MKITLALDVRPDAEVELEVAGNTVKGRGAGALNLQINPKANIFEIYGDYTIAEGSFMLSLQQIINKRFTIESGSSIQWTGSPMNAMLDIDAVYKVKASLQPLLQGTADLGGDRSVPVECVIHLGERLSNPARSPSTCGFPAPIPRRRAVIANALDPRDGRHAVPLPAAVQQLHVRELVAGLVEHRQLGVGGHGTGVRVEHGQQLAFDRPTTTW